MKHKVLIELDDGTQEVNVEGPWEDGVLFLGMLEMARLAFFESRSQVPEKQTRLEKKLIELPLKGRPS